MIKFIFLFFILSAALSGCSKDGQELDVVISVESQSIIYNGEESAFSATFSEPIDEAIFYFDGHSIGSVISAPYSVKFTPVDVVPGMHEVKCIGKVGGRSFSGEANVEVVLRLGDEFQGGRIFSLDASGKSGLVASVSDLSYSGPFGEEVRFSWGSDGLLGTSLEDGKENTRLMASASASSGYAGFHFKNGLSLNGFSDWYIPSYRELELLKDNKGLVGGFSDASDWRAIYWSSSESSETIALQLNLNVLMGNYGDKSGAFRVRPIRSFNFD